MKNTLSSTYQEGTGKSVSYGMWNLLLVRSTEGSQAIEKDIQWGETLAFTLR